MKTDKVQKIEDWEHATRKALDALFIFRSYLQAWKIHPGPVSDELFMSVVQDLSDDGLLEWLDGSAADIDKLREVLTNDTQ